MKNPTRFLWCPCTLVWTVHSSTAVTSYLTQSSTTPLDTVMGFIIIIGHMQQQQNSSREMLARAYDQEICTKHINNNSNNDDREQQRKLQCKSSLSSGQVIMCNMLWCPRIPALWDCLEWRLDSGGSIKGLGQGMSLWVQCTVEGI